MNSSDDEEMTQTSTSTGRRLRQRTVQVTRTDGADCSTPTNRRFKRKAEVTVENLYRQQNVKEVTSTPLETIYESPRHKKGGKWNIREETVGDTDLSVMAVKKLKRLCLFASHYNPSKQKIRSRKERARKMKQLKGVKIPKGTSISFKDLEAVLACLSEDENQNENNHITNSTFSSLTESVGFYSGNIIQPDMGNTSVDDITQNMNALLVDNSKLHKEIHLDLENIMTDPIFHEDFLSSSITDEPLKPQSLNSREKKTRRRSGKLSWCLLQPLCKTLEEPLNKIQNKGEESSLNQHCLLMTDSSLTTSSPADDKEKPCISEVCESSLIVKEISNDKCEQMGTELHKTSKDRKTKESVTHIQKDVEKYSEFPDEQRTAAKQRAKQRKPQNEQGNEIKKAKKLEIGLKRSGKSEADSVIKKRRSSKATDSLGKKEVPSLPSNATSEIMLLSPDNGLYTDLQSSQEVTVSKSTRGTVQKKGNKQRKRRVSGIQRPLYRTILEPESDTSNSTSDHLDSTADASFTNCVEPCMKLKSTSIVSQDGIAISQSPTVPPVGDTVICYSPSSPSAQMAALSLHTDQFSTSPSVNTVQLPITHYNMKTKQKVQRRSARLSIERITSEGLLNNSASGFGSYWSAISPHSPITTNVESISTRSDCESQCEKKTVKGNVIRRNRAQTKEFKNRRQLEMLHKLDLKVEAEETEVTGNKDASSSVADHLAATVSSERESESDNSVNVVPLRECRLQISSHLHDILDVTELNDQSLIVPSHSTRIDNPLIESLSNVAVQENIPGSVDTLCPDNEIKYDKPPFTIQIKQDINSSESSHKQVGILPELSDGDVEREKKNDKPELQYNMNVHAVQSDPSVTSVSCQVSGPIDNLATICISRVSSNDKQSLSQCSLVEYSGDHIELNSPIISGMFENKMSIKQGKIYCNKDASRSSPVTLSLLCCSDSKIHSQDLEPK